MKFDVSITLAFVWLFFYLAEAGKPVSSTSSGTSRKRKQMATDASNSPKVHLHNPSGHAVLLSDLKLDDTIAIDHLARSEKYDTMHVIGTGINDHQKAKGHLDDFVKKQGLRNGKTKILYYSGGENVLRQSAEKTHEKNFQGSPKRVKLNADSDLKRKLGKGNKVDVYSIAPAHERHLNALADNRDIHLRTVHHLAGYNSNIQHSDNKKPEFDHWSSMNKRIKTNHPKADLLLTSTPQTFTDQSGSTVAYDRLKNRYPKNHLEAAKKDPFHVNQLEKAEKYVVPHRKENKNIPNLSPDNDKPLQQHINQARFEEAKLPKEQQRLRNHFNSYLDHALPIIKKEAADQQPKLHYRLENGVRDAFNSSPRLEACDGVHIACVNNVRKQKDHKNVVSGTFYRDTKNEGEKAILRLRQSKPGDPHHGHLVINQTGKDAT